MLETGELGTDYTYTGQRSEAALGLMYYVARWYDVEIGHFVQADTIVPGAGNPAAWNRYAYVMYNPLKYVDPSGHQTEGVWCMNHPDDPGCQGNEIDEPEDESQESITIEYCWPNCIVMNAELWSSGTRDIPLIDFLNHEIGYTSGEKLVLDSNSDLTLYPEKQAIGISDEVLTYVLYKDGSMVIKIKGLGSFILGEDIHFIDFVLKYRMNFNGWNTVARLDFLMNAKASVNKIAVSRVDGFYIEFMPFQDMSIGVFAQYSIGALVLCATTGDCEIPNQILEEIINQPAW